MSDNSSSPTKIIAIVGAGFSGALTAVNLLRQNPGDALRIILVDRGTRPGRGLAYGTWDDNFLLNVPAGNMSALADDPDHFVRFCQHIDPAFNSATFASRRLYGDYLELTLRQEAERNRGTSLEKVHGEAIAVRQQPGDNAYQIDLANGRSIRARPGCSRTRPFSSAESRLPLPAFIKQAPISAIRGILPRWSAAMARPR